VARRRSVEDEPKPERVLEIPHDAVNEQVVIAAALADNDARKMLVARFPTADWFQVAEHRPLWAAVIELTRRGLEPSAPTLRQLGGDKLNAEYVERLTATHPTLPPNLQHHVDALQWDRARADAARGPVSAMLEALQSTATPPDRLRALAKQVAASFDGHGALRYLRDPKELAREQSVDLRNRINGQACFPFGIDGLDVSPDGTPRLIPGAAPGKVTVITGISGGGKSTLTARVGLGVGRQRRRVLYGAWEMEDGVTLELLAGMALEMSRTRMRTGMLTEDEIVQVEQKMEQLGGYITFMRSPFDLLAGRYSTERVLDTIQQHISDTGCDVAIFDLWDRAFMFEHEHEERRALARMQAIAQETRCHVILCQQQRLKDVEQRADKRPTREGIKGSSAWVDVADTILGVHLPSLWQRVPATTIEVITLKQRFGRWPFVTEFDWDAERGSFEKGRDVPYEPPGAIGGKSDLDNWTEAKPAKKAKK
jgi:replicative DNA helicase